MTTDSNADPHQSTVGPQSADADKPLPLRMRGDLVIEPMRFGGRRYWSIKDPLSSRYYQLREEEYFVLKQLDGRTSAADIKDRFQHEFPPRKVNDVQLQQFLGMLHRQGLLLVNVPGQGEHLLDRRDRMNRRQRMQSLTSVLAIRFRGIDPDRLLDWLYPMCRWMFSKLCMFACIMLVIAALGLVLVQFETLQSKLPRASAFFSRENLILIALAIGISKILHEFGHALACKHFGGHCHEMGLMFLVFTPCLYCNVSDAWLMPNKWHRIAISAAGLCVEIVLAAVCTLLWWFSEPGVLNSLCLSMMFVCSVSTVLFNGNPLLRYDGYYILSDLVEVPNMRQQSTFLLRRILARWCLGMELGSQRMLPERKRGFLVGYAIAAVLYRFIVVAAILWFLHVVLTPLGFVVAAQLITVMVLFGMIIVPFIRGARFMAAATRHGHVKPVRALGCLIIFAGIVAGICLWPLPYSVKAPAILQLADGRRVDVADVAGRVVSAKRIGDPVAENEPIFTLQNHMLRREYQELQGEVAAAQVRLDRLREMQSAGKGVSGQLDPAEQELSRKRSLLVEKQKQIDALTVRAPLAGIVLPARHVEHHPREGELEPWSGTPLDPENTGCYVESGTTVCWVGNPGRMEATLIVDQQDIEFLQIGRNVRIRLDQLQVRFLEGTLVSIAESKLDETPPEFVASGLVPSAPDEGGRMRPTNAVFQARVSLDQHDLPLLLRATGQAKIEAGSQTLGQRMLRYLRQTFRFEL